MRITHKHPIKKKSPERTCPNCIHAHKVEDEYDKTYECDAEVYDIRHLTCFVPREEQTTEN